MAIVSPSCRWRAPRGARACRRGDSRKGAAARTGAAGEARRAARSAATPAARRRRAAPAGAAPAAALLEHAHVPAVARVAPPHARVPPAPAVLEHPVVAALLARGAPTRRTSPPGARVWKKRRWPRSTSRCSSAALICFGSKTTCCASYRSQSLVMMRPCGVEVAELLGAGQRREDVEHHRVDVVLEGEGRPCRAPSCGVSLSAPSTNMPWLRTP